MKDAMKPVEPQKDSLTVAIVRLFTTSHLSLLFLLISLLAGFGEELLFRGVLQGWLTELAGPWTGVLAAAVVFGLLNFLY